MSEHPIGHRPVNWGAVGVLVTLGAYALTGAMGYAIVREQGNNNKDSIEKLQAQDREHTAGLAKMREDRSIETKINDLTLEVRLLRQQVEQSNNKKR